MRKPISKSGIQLIQEIFRVNERVKAGEITKEEGADIILGRMKLKK